MKTNTVVIIFLSVLLTASCGNIGYDALDALKDDNTTDNDNNNPSDIPRDGLVGEYLFNGNANDTSGNNNHGTLGAAAAGDAAEPILTTDRFGNASNAYSFDGTDDIIEVADSPELQTGTKGTVSAWIYAHNNTTSVSIITKDGDGFNDDFYLGLGLVAGYEGKPGIRFDIPPSTCTYQYSDSVIQLNRWVHIVAVWDDTGYYLYQDATLIKEKTNSVKMISSGNPVRIGAGKPADGSVFFDGLIDDVRIYNRALSVSEINSLYHEGDWAATVPVTPAGLTAGTITSVSIELTWNSVVETAGYRLYRADATAGPYTQIGSDITSETAYTDKDLSASTTYYYKVSAYNANGESEKSGNITGTTAAALDVPRTGLVGEWLFGDADSGTAADTCGDGSPADGTVTGATAAADRFGNPDNAYSFNGSSNYITIADSTQILGSNPDEWSVSLFAKPDAPTVASTDLISDYDSSSWDLPHAIHLTIYQADLKFRSSIRTPADNSYETVSAVVDFNKYYHIVLVHSKISLTTKLYVNGDLVDTLAITNVDYFDGGILRIGASRYQGNVTNFFKGTLDDIRIYNRALTEAEIIALYSEGNSNLGKIWHEAASSPDFSAREEFSGVEFHGKMWIMGGLYSGPSYKNDVWYSTDGTAWTKAVENAGWSARYGHTSVVYDNKIWVLGGDNGGVRKNDVWYSTDGITWEKAIENAGWSPRTTHTSLIFDNKMWVIGGIDNTPSYKNDVWYSSDGITWNPATSNALWSGRQAHSSVVYDNMMWVIAGNGGGYKNNVYYSSDGITWYEATSAALWSERSGHKSVVLNNKMWLLGGWDYSNKNDVWHSTDGDTWTKAIENADWSGRYHFVSFVFDSKIFVIGGTDGSQKNDVWYSEGGWGDKNNN